MRGAIPILSVVHRWYCPNCRMTDVTREARPHSRLHPCPKLHGLMAPLLPVGTHAKVEAHLREDYVGRELVQVADNGRPYMNVTTTRDDGQDAIVFAPAARFGLS